MHELLSSPEHIQEQLRQNLEALTDPIAYQRNLLKGKPVDKRHLPKAAFPILTTDPAVAILTFYEEQNFLSPKDQPTNIKEIDILAPAGTPVVAPEDGYIVRAFRTQLIEKGMEAHQDTRELIFSASSGIIYLFGHLKESDLSPEAKKLENFVPIGRKEGLVYVRAGEQISTVAQWDIPWSDYEQRGIQLPSRVGEMFARLNRPLDASHLHLEAFDFRPYERGINDGFGYQRGHFSTSSYREFNPLHLFPRLFAQK